MTIHIRLFAIIRERAKRAAFDIDLAPASTVGDAMDAIRVALPAASELLSRCAVAVNQEYVPTSTTLNEGDELAIIPPVSGG